MTTMRMFKIDSASLDTLNALIVHSHEIQSQQFELTQKDKSQTTVIIKDKKALIEAILTNTDVSIPNVGKISFVSIAPDVLPGDNKMLFVLSSLDDYRKNTSLGHIFHTVQNLEFITANLPEEIKKAEAAMKEQNKEQKDSSNIAVSMPKTKKGYTAMSTVDTDETPDETPGSPDEEKANTRTTGRSFGLRCNFFDCLFSLGEIDQNNNNGQNQLTGQETQPASQTMGSSNN